MKYTYNYEKLKNIDFTLDGIDLNRAVINYIRKLVPSLPSESSVSFDIGFGEGEDGEIICSVRVTLTHEEENGETIIMKEDI